MQIIGHKECYELLERMLQAYEKGGYKRLCQYGPGESVLFDSQPAPGYVPGAKGKAETGVDYTPKADGTRIHIYYVSAKKPSETAKKEASRAIRAGMDTHEYMGRLVSIRRVASGAIQLQFTVGNRDKIEDGKYTDKVALRSPSVTKDPKEKGGLIVAMAFDQSLGIPYEQLRSLMESEKAQAGDMDGVSDELKRTELDKDIIIAPRVVNPEGIEGEPK
jgi:hypothetical protein